MSLGTFYRKFIVKSILITEIHGLLFTDTESVESLAQIVCTETTVVYRVTRVYTTGHLLGCSCRALGGIFILQIRLVPINAFIFYKF
jgi:hypothetical protein